MEQATNQFTKGMQLDTHPMVQSNDTLTDCLNGTLITMNGNEVILQNDMGNRRVDKAFLPPGYEPVGMKEYGGIIYVAAYNPITNKSQIGSFPSPQKKLSSQGTNSGNFDFSTITDSKGVNVEQDATLNIKVLKSDSFMLPLTRNLNLRAGDKFAIYSEGLSELKNLLTNYDNIQGNKAYSPKNKKYTLQLGVLNSQNEFVDITKTLCRWKDFGEEVAGENEGETVWQPNWQPVKYDSEVSEIFKFNDGYFISDAFTNTFNTQTIEDAKLIKERQKIAANTYSYKLVGPLYLKLSLNHIENFNYNVYGTNNNGVATLWFEGYLTYNCPDGASGQGDNSNESYVTFDEGTVSTDFGFDIIGKTPANVEVGQSTYNPSTNTYAVKIVKKYTNITGNNGIFDYVIGVKADVDTADVYLRGLSTKGSINLDLLGSGEVSFSGWKFYNNLEDKSTLLTFAFDAYPEYGKSFTNLKFKFNGIDYPKSGYLPMYNGKQTISFSWNELGLNPQTVYTVTASYFVMDNETGAYLQENVQVNDSVTRWFLTTELFNEFYPSSSGISDFCSVDQANTDFYNKMKVKPSIQSTIKNGSDKPYAEPEGELIKHGSTDISFLYKHTQRVSIEVQPKFVIENSKLYPTSVGINGTNADKIEINSVYVSKLGNITNPSADDATQSVLTYNTVFKQLLTTTEGPGITTSGTNNPTTALNKQSLIETQVTNTTNTIQGYIKYYDAYKGLGESIRNITNAFDNFSETLNTNEALPGQGDYGGVVVNYDEHAGSGDDHYVNVVLDQTNNNVTLPSDSDMPDGWFGVSDQRGDSRKLFKISNLASRIYQLFNNKTDGRHFSFLYLFCDDNYFTRMENQTSGTNGKYYTRVWWKMPNGEWAVFPDLLKKEGGTAVDIVSFIKKGVANNKELVYCMYNDYTGDGFNYAARDNFKYYNSYNIPLDYTISYKITQGITAANIVSVGPTYGNLAFVAESPELNSDKVSYNLKSSEQFFDTINTLNTDTISNVYLKTGARYDSMGRPLNPSYVYCLRDGKLERIDDGRFYVDSANPVNNRNRLLYNKIRKGAVNPQYQSASDDDSHTLLAYNSVNIVDAV